MLEIGYVNAPYRESVGLFATRERLFSTFDVSGELDDLRHLLTVVSSVGSDGGVEQIEARTLEGGRAILLVVRTRHPLTAAALDHGVLVTGDADALADVAEAIRTCIRGGERGQDGYHVHLEAGGGESDGVPAADLRVYVRVRNRTHNPPL